MGVCALYGSYAAAHSQRCQVRKLYSCRIPGLCGQVPDCGDSSSLIATGLVAGVFFAVDVVHVGHRQHTIVLSACSSAGVRRVGQMELYGDICILYAGMLLSLPRDMVLYKMKSLNALAVIVWPT